MKALLAVGVVTVVLFVVVMVAFVREGQRQIDATDAFMTRVSQ